jgi:glycogen debranching enzyme
MARDNGIGGFASSTIVGMNPRRYHGLLVASLKPPVGRFVMLSKLEETLVVDGVPHDLFRAGVERGSTAGRARQRTGVAGGVGGTYRSIEV